jgi:hypothetical protein
LMSLYESFLLLNMFRMLFHSSSGAGDCMWVYCSVSSGIRVQVGAHGTPTCTRIPPYSSRIAPIHQYTPKQSSTPTYSHQLLRMNVIAFETCWAIKNFRAVTSSSIYSTSKMMHGPINIRFTKWRSFYLITCANRLFCIYAFLEILSV